ncbi:hypothetical protein ACJJTC_013225 [Scirpophaga incertulas]
MPSTRSAVRKQQQDSRDPPMVKTGENRLELKSEGQQASPVKIPSTKRSRSKASSTSSHARRLQLELQAAEEKARIDKELVDKRLAAELAEIKSSYSSRSNSRCSMSEVGDWIDRSQRVLRAQVVNDLDQNKANLCPPGEPASSAAVPGPELIGADGANSAVRKAMGVQYLSWNYNQMGVVATLHLAEETENTTAWQRWLPNGPIALLPLDSTRSSLVWSTWQDEARRLLKLPEDQFIDALNDALWKQYPRSKAVEACMSWLSSCLQKAGLPDGVARQLPPSVKSIVPNSRAAFPLGFGHSTRYVAPGVVLIGDAAHRVHPLAGQGVNLGFGDVKDLTELLSDAIYTGYDITHHEWMEKYETLRQKHNLPTQLAVDALHRLYTVELPPIVLARSLGLQITNALQPIKVKI